MIRFARILLLAAAFTPGTANAQAARDGGRPIRLAAGETRRVAFHYVYGTRTCQGGAVPSIEVGATPRGFKIEVREEDGPVRDRRAPCPGAVVRGRALYVTPEPGFRGEATVRYVARTELQRRTALASQERGFSRRIAVR